MKRKPYLILIPITLLLLLPFVIQQLWNHLITDLFPIRAIGYWEALGLFILCRMLFGNFGFGRRSHKASDQVRKQWMNMSDDDRKRLREEWKRRKSGC